MKNKFANEVHATSHRLAGGSENAKGSEAAENKPDPSCLGRES